LEKYRNEVSFLLKKRTNIGQWPQKNKGKTSFFFWLHLADALVFLQKTRPNIWSHFASQINLCLFMNILHVLENKTKTLKEKHFLALKHS